MSVVMSTVASRSHAVSVVLLIPIAVTVWFFAVKLVAEGVVVGFAPLLKTSHPKTIAEQKVQEEFLLKGLGYAALGLPLYALGIWTLTFALNASQMLAMVVSPACWGVARWTRRRGKHRAIAIALTLAGLFLFFYCFFGR